MNNSIPDHIKDQIYLYIWLNAIEKLNIEYHAKFYLHDTLEYHHILFLKDPSYWDNMACNWRYLGTRTDYDYIYKLFNPGFKTTLLPKNYF